MSGWRAWLRALALGVAALGAGPAAAGKAPAAKVEIKHFAFAPEVLTVTAGTRVVWTNRDDEPHIVVSAGNRFASSKAMDTDETYATVFDRPGTYAYFCSIHPHMVGTVIVR
ncbi:cupredoxin domain-containing protein [Dyella marensis]|uniref:Plastocyanin n=1 Tax=Dyella marensis TaxID=500610 RepID=A0A1I2DCD3_9GAMM|nr:MULTISPECIES: cupredoxin domain-containing protein [Dyella]SFE78184.1 Plastocyanin [Dyella marensis]